ncbi:stage III sporulation protein AG [Clostridium saccharobutylicum]|uniref:stage III sporulation protein AG n=1 Tax=Clostridium saccharobutylicum TaxID=169679 RepID=UPI0007E26B94|nr:stage III sporulation protein AG [Clostridium saccharobutylicum]OAV40129.1 stage III sporulation protein AG [Clostridium saccharobutylicum DSM 13864]
MWKDKLKNELTKILKDKKLNNLIAICAVLAFALIAMNVLLPVSKKDATSKISSSTNTQNKENTNDTSASKTTSLFLILLSVFCLNKNILKKMDGVGDVEVMISFENGEQKVPAYDKNTQQSTTEETDTSGGKRVTNQNTDGSKVVMSSSDGNNEPVILTTYKPKITGVVIVAEGAENSKTKYEIEQAISKLYNLSLDKVNVYSMKK